MPKRLKVDLTVIILLFIASAFVSVFFQVKFLVSTILYFAVPSFYLIIRELRNLKRILVASILIGVIFAFSLDFLATFNNAWSWASGDKLILHQKIFGVLVPENMIWFFFWVFSILVFYEHFIEHDPSILFHQEFGTD